MSADGASSRPARGLAAAALIACACAAAVGSVRHAGASARRAGPALDLASDRVPVHVVATTADLDALWRLARIHGRKVVHVGAFLHFVAPETPASYRVSKEYPLRVEPGADTGASRSHRSFLWAAMYEGAARELWYVLPPGGFEQRFGKRWAGPKDDVVTHEHASRRTISTRPPPADEPVVLNVDASWFSYGDPAALARELRGSGLTSDLVTVSLSADSPDVTDSDRRRALDFVTMLGERAVPRARGEALRAP